MRTHLIATHAAALLLSGTSIAAAQEPFQWQGTIPAGRQIEVRGIIGDIRAVPATGNQAQVTATRVRGEHGNPQDVQIRVVERGEGVVICAVYPGSNRGERRNECDSDGSRNGNAQRNDTRVNFTVRVPAGVQFAGRTVNGDIEAVGLRSEVSAHTVNGKAQVSTTGNAEVRTVNGDVQLSTGGYGQASTVSGDINAVIGRANWTEPLDFRTVSGNILLTLPAAIDARLRAQSMSGRIESEFPIEQEQRRMQSRASAILGRGGRELNLQTLSGNIRVRRAS